MGTERQPLGEFEIFVISAIIGAGEDAYGVSVHEGVEKIAEREVSQGAIYTTLMRLEEKGLVASSLGEPSAERGGKAKRYYSVNAPGQKALRSALEAMERAARVVASSHGWFNGATLC